MVDVNEMADDDEDRRQRLEREFHEAAASERARETQSNLGVDGARPSGWPNELTSWPYPEAAPSEVARTFPGRWPVKNNYDPVQGRMFRPRRVHRIARSPSPDRRRRSRSRSPIEQRQELPQMPREVSHILEKQVLLGNRVTLRQLLNNYWSAGIAQKRAYSEIYPGLVASITRLANFYTNITERSLDDYVRYIEALRPVDFVYDRVVYKPSYRTPLAEGVPSPIYYPSAVKETVRRALVNGTDPYLVYNKVLKAMFINDEATVVITATSNNNPCIALEFGSSDATETTLAPRAHDSIPASGKHPRASLAISVEEDILWVKFTLFARQIPAIDESTANEHQLGHTGYAMAGNRRFEHRSYTTDDIASWPRVRDTPLPVGWNSETGPLPPRNYTAVKEMVDDTIRNLDFDDIKNTLEDLVNANPQLFQVYQVNPTRFENKPPAFYLKHTPQKVKAIIEAAINLFTCRNLGRQRPRLKPNLWESLVGWGDPPAFDPVKGLTDLIVFSTSFQDLANHTVSVMDIAM